MFIFGISVTSSSSSSVKPFANVSMVIFFHLTPTGPAYCDHTVSYYAKKACGVTCTVQLHRLHYPTTRHSPVHCVYQRNSLLIMTPMVGQPGCSSKTANNLLKGKISSFSKISHFQDIILAYLILIYLHMYVQVSIYRYISNI